MAFTANPALHDQVMRAADPHAGRAARQIASRASQLAPEDTGALERSIGSRRLDEAHHEVFVGTDYWAPVEYGHRKVAWGHETGEYVPAQPFMRPALYGSGGTL